MLGKFVPGDNFLHVQQVRPVVVNANGASNGVGIDFQAYPAGYKDVVFLFGTGDLTSNGTVAVVNKLQDSDNGTDWTDVTDLDIVNAASVTISAENSVARLSYRLAKGKRYVRPVSTTAFTGGTSPTLGLAVDAILLNPRWVINS